MSKHSVAKSGLMYLGIGIINTCVGYGVIFLALWCGFMPEVANIIGYGVGFIISYILNKTFTFASPSSHKRDLPRFLLAMGVAYIAQFITMSCSYRIFGLNAYIAQIVGGAVYVCIGFVMSRYYAFRS
ncbi:GtrA family protein [Helicobacter marmotae]|uniref:GtrA family protein n=1 Tax=Helicobacter marmotae TaxID=152490 RepID=A0A3D8I6D4_9HELI|nr:GtrA family protein [Helicobacter marmotae]RDU60535.1 GtrA family protein [Helicobacter marmotae]